MSWPPKVMFRDSNRDAFARRRAEKLDRAIEALTLLLERVDIDASEAGDLAVSLSELHTIAARLQDKYFNGDGRSKRKHRKKKEGVRDILK